LLFGGTHRTFVLFFTIHGAGRHVKVSQPGLHGLAHHEPGWKWVNPIRFSLWWARNFTTLLNPSRVGGLSGLAHQPT